MLFHSRMWDDSEFHVVHTDISTSTVGEAKAASCVAARLMNHLLVIYANFM